jgi:hypothetical protein
LFARLRRAAAWPCALLLACALVLGGVFAADPPTSHPAKAAVADSAADVHCAGHDTAPGSTTGPTPAEDCCGSACGCAFAHAIGPLPGAMARHAFEPACPLVAQRTAFHAKPSVPPQRPPIA